MLRTSFALVLLAVLATAVPATAQERNPWLSQRVINFAHQGGEDELPSNTMYALRESLVTKGADLLELDVNLPKDDRIVVMHDTTLDRTTNGTGPVRERTYAEISQLDAAHRFVPGVGTSTDPAADYRFRGVRTGARKPPKGYRRADFRVPTLEEVLGRFQDTPVNIEIKGDEATQMRIAEILARQLTQLGSASRELFIVVSFNQKVVDRFHELAPQIAVAPGVEGGARFLFQNQSPGGGVVAFQIPITFKFGDQPLTVATPDNVKRAHEAGYAVHVWLSNDTEDVATYKRLLAMCVDGIMAAKPGLLERTLRKQRVGGPTRPGTDPCGTRVARRRASASGGRVTLNLRRRGLSKERRSGRIQLFGIGRRDAGVVMARGSFRLASDADTATARVRLTRAGRRAVRRAGRVRMRAIVRERGVLASRRLVSVG
jgi:glycerophosphoryl diester phosphodiesterase